MAKFYAVAKGLSGTPNIYGTWAECQKEINGCKGAIYKSFSTREQAQNFLDMQINNCKTLETADNSLLTIYVDGSFKEIEGNYSYGLVAVLNDEVVYKENGIGEKEQEALALRNISGEVLGAMKAVDYAVKNGNKEINLCYDYQGIECWALGTWDRRGNIPENYHKFMQEKLKSIKINFIKIKGHSGVKYNEMADKLAGSALSK
jgi:ribonuclease HI